jgi:hypothetical protein
MIVKTDAKSRGDGAKDAYSRRNNLNTHRSRAFTPV